MEFPASDYSLYYTKATPKNIRWRRPHVIKLKKWLYLLKLLVIFLIKQEICANPQFIVDDVSRFDLDQGCLGNCWLIAAVSMITQRPMIFEFVIPQDQSLDPNEGYNGLFHFRFWQFGKWYDVIVDGQVFLLLAFYMNHRLKLFN